MGSCSDALLSNTDGSLCGQEGDKAKSSSLVLVSSSFHLMYNQFVV